MNTAAIEQEITRLESERCRSLVDGDMDTLETLVADDLVHIHANGHVDDKSGYLTLVKERISFLSARRDNLQVRVLGDIAIATGSLDQTITISGGTQSQAMRIMTTQVWRHEEHSGDWRQISFQATNIVNGGE